jgi:aurora kinase, other
MLAMGVGATAIGSSSLPFPPPPPLLSLSPDFLSSGGRRVREVTATAQSEGKSRVDGGKKPVLQDNDAPRTEAASGAKSSRFSTTAEQPYSPTTALLHGNRGTTAGSYDGVAVSTSSSSLCSAPQRIHQHELHAADFQHEEVLGEGSYSIVSLATHRTSGLLFALKEIDRARVQHLQLEAQLRWEINLQRILRHPNIVRLYSYFITSSCISLVLEYCRGGTLLQRVKAAPHGRLTEHQASRYTRHVAKALTHLHSLGVAHRDLKLENVLVDEDGIAKLADFGWSRPVSVACTPPLKKERPLPSANQEDDRCPQQCRTEASETTSTTASGGSDRPGIAGADVEEEGEVEGRHTVCGTLDYLSPEMVSGQTHSFKTDVWSLGVMLAEMLTGVPPFYRESAQQTLHAIQCEAPNLHGPASSASSITTNGATADGVAASPPRQGQERVALSSGVLSLMEAMLQKDPAKRPAMQEVLRHPWLQKPARGVH